MKYRKIVHGRFYKRLNRFIAEVYINEKREQVHIKNTGRLIELLQPNTEVLLEDSDNHNRKTKYSMVAVAKNNEWVNIDSLAPNTIVFEALIAGKLSEIGWVTLAKREITYGESRFDIYYEKENEKGFIEIKGITLERNGIALFPDAPTSRGTKHVMELTKALKEGYTSTILFVVQMKGCYAFSANREMDMVFSDSLLNAAQQGVRILVYDTIVKEDEIVLDKSIPILIPFSNNEL